MNRSIRGFLSLAAFVASVHAASAQPAFESRANETLITDTSYLPASLSKSVDLNHDSAVDPGVVVTRFESEGKFVFEVVASKIVVLKNNAPKASRAAEQDAVSVRIRDTSYLPSALGKFVDSNGDTYVDFDTAVTSVQTASATVFSAVKTPKYYDVKGVEIVVR